MCVEYEIWSNLPTWAENSIKVSSGENSQSELSVQSMWVRRSIKERWNMIYEFFTQKFC